MEKDDLQKSKPETNNASRDRNREEETTVSNNQDLQAGLGRDRMKDEDWDASSNKNTARNFDDLKNEKLNAANDS